MNKPFFFGIATLFALVIGFSGVRIVDELDQRQFNARLQAASSDFDRFRAHATIRAQRPVSLVRGLGQGVQSLLDLQGRAAAPFTPNVLKGASLQFISAIAINPTIDQLRLLSPSGQEILRVNDSKSGVPARVPDELLQDKTDTEYMSELQHLGYGEVYSSCVSLNEERGQLDPRQIPTLRIGVSVRNVDGEVIGYLLANFIDPLSPVARVEDVDRQPEIYWLEGRGEFLYGGRRFEDREFRWQTGATGKSFAELYPDLWLRIRQEGKGQADLPDGRYVWQTNYSVMAKEVFEGLGLNSMAQRFAAAVQYLPNEYLYGGLIRKSPLAWLGAVGILALYLGLVIVLYRFLQARDNERRLLQESEKRRAALEQESARRVRLLSTVSHEIRTPAASIAMITGAINRKKTAEEVEIADLANHLLRLMDELKRVGSPQSQGAIEFKSVKPSELIQDESPRVFRRPLFLRGYLHDEYKTLFARSA